MGNINKNINRIITIIRNEDIGIENYDFIPTDIRYAVRGIVKSDKGQIAILNKKLKNEYKLPGGGIEKGENNIEALKREIFEETGCIVDVINFLGIAMEEKSSTNFEQFFYVYESKVIQNTNV